MTCRVGRRWHRATRRAPGAWVRALGHPAQYGAQRGAGRREQGLRARVRATIGASDWAVCMFNLYDSYVDKNMN